LRDECLNEYVFTSLGEARAIIEAWRHDYNQLRPHSSLGYLAPEEFAARNQRNSASARSAWPANQELAGALQGASASDPEPDSFSAALRECRAAGKTGLNMEPKPQTTCPTRGEITRGLYS